MDGKSHSRIFRAIYELLTRAEAPPDEGLDAGGDGGGPGERGAHGVGRVRGQRGAGRHQAQAALAPSGNDGDRVLFVRGGVLDVSVENDVLDEVRVAVARLVLRGEHNRSGSRVG